MSIEQRLSKWREDVCAFAEEALWVEYPETKEMRPLKLQEHQRQFLQESTRRGPDGRFVHKVACASWPKREGKSAMVAVLCAWRLACYTRQNVGVLANSERQAQSNVFDAVMKFFRNSPALAGLVADDAYQTRKLTVAALDNVMEAWPCNYRTIQGLAFDVLACDELHAADDGGKAYTFASQQTERADAQVLISSQAGAPIDTNPLWKLYQAAKDGKAHVLFDYRQEPVAPWAVERAAKARPELTAGEFDYLWRNAWGATGLKLFAAADVEAAVLDFIEPETREQWLRLCNDLGFGDVRPSIGFGLDRAGVSASGDATVFAVTAKFEPEGAEPLFLIAWARILPTGAEAEVLACDRKAREVFGEPDQVFLEQYNCSDLEEKIRGAELRAPTVGNQADIYGRLDRLFREQRIRFLASAGIDPRTREPGQLKAQLIAFGYDCQRGDGDGGVKVKWKTQRGPDDLVDGCAWATSAADVQPLSVFVEVWGMDGDDDDGGGVHGGNLGRAIFRR